MEIIELIMSEVCSDGALCALAHCLNIKAGVQGAVINLISSRPSVKANVNVLFICVHKLVKKCFFF